MDASDAQEEPVPCGSIGFSVVWKSPGTNIIALAVDSARVYWAQNPNKLSFAPKNGAASVVPHLFVDLRGIATDSFGNAYVADQGDGGVIWIFRRDGGLDVAAKMPAMTVAVDPGALYSVTDLGQAFAAPLDGGASFPIGDAGFTRGSVTSLAIDQGALFATFDHMLSCNTDGAASGVVLYRGMSVCHPVSGPVISHIHAMDAAVFYGIKGCGQNTIIDETAELCDGATQGLIPSGEGPNPADFAMDEKAFYWLGPTGVAYACRVGGAHGTFSLDSNAVGTGRIAVDENYVYVSAYSEIYRSTKPCCP